MASERRLLFGQVAPLYDRARPGYPDQLVNDVLAFAEAQAGDRALEVGAGTGKATRTFAARGLTVVALEPSPEMAAVARQNFAGQANVIMQQSDFESWRPGEEQYALVYSAQAWHWVAPEIGYERARQALRPGGVLAVFWNRARWDLTPLRGEIDEVYERFAGELAGRWGPMYPRQADTHWMTDWDSALAGAAGFHPPQARDYSWTQLYTSHAYTSLLGTHSDHLSLPPESLAALRAAVAEVIDRHGGSVELPYATRLLMARGGP